MQRTARSLDFPVAFRVCGLQSCMSATLLQLGLGGCRLRTWCILPIGERVTLELPRTDGTVLSFDARVRQSTPVTGAHEYALSLEPMSTDDEDVLAREAALLVRRRHTAA